MRKQIALLSAFVLACVVVFVGCGKQEEAAPNVLTFTNVKVESASRDGWYSERYAVFKVSGFVKNETNDSVDANSMPMLVSDDKNSKVEFKPTLAQDKLLPGQACNITYEGELDARQKSLPSLSFACDITCKGLDNAQQELNAALAKVVEEYVKKDENQKNQQRRATVLELNKAEPKTTLLEYAKKSVDPRSLVPEPKDAGVKLAVEPSKNIDLSSLGEHKVTYTVSFEGESKSTKIVYKVRDTQAPVIKVNKDKVEVQQGGGYAPKSNVKSVKDPVDGDLLFVEEEPAKLEDPNQPSMVYEKGWYTVEGAYDNNVPNKYNLTVVACDIHGNRQNKEFVVLVNKAPDPKPAPATTPEIEPGLESSPNSESTRQPEPDVTSEPAQEISVPVS